jgi:hypothetical protein
MTAGRSSDIISSCSAALASPTGSVIGLQWYDFTGFLRLGVDFSCSCAQLSTALNDRLDSDFQGTTTTTYYI